MGPSFYGFALAALSLALPASAADTRARVQGVQEAIRSSGARWTAGETSVSGLPEEEWADLIGLETAPPTGPAVPEPPARFLPRALDWRDNGGNFVTRPKSQGKCGSCWSFAMTGALESYVLRKSGAPGADLDLSEQVYRTNNTLDTPIRAALGIIIVSDARSPGGGNLCPPGAFYENTKSLRQNRTLFDLGTDSGYGGVVQPIHT